MTPNTAPALAQAERQPKPAAIAPIEEMLRGLVKAVRAHQLYLQNNPIYVRSIETLRTSFAAIWAQIDELPLVISESDFSYEGRPVLVERTRGADSLPWMFFKDGFRELRLVPGFEQEECVQLLDVIQRARKASPDEDDLLTMMWEKEFSHLRYTFVDLATEGAQVLDEAPPDLTATPAIQVQQLVEETPQGDRANVVRLEDFDATLYFLEEKEIEYLRAEIAGEYARDLRPNVIAILFDVYEQQVDAAVREEISTLLDSLTLHFLSAGHFSAVAYLLREAQATAGRARELSAAQKNKLASLPDRLSAPEALSQLLQALDESAELPDEGELTLLFEQLRGGALGPIFVGLAKIQNSAVRQLLEKAASRLASTNTAELVKLIGAREPVISAEAMRRAAALKTPAAVAPLLKVLVEGDAAARLLAVQALAEIGSAGAMQTLEQAIDDADRDVRIATVKAIAARQYRAALPRIQAAVNGRGLREADLTEKMAFFETFGELSGDAGIKPLDEILTAKGFLGKREDPELRACAAMALGRIGSPAAHEVLRRVLTDKALEKEVLVRNAVNRALKERKA